MRSLVSALCWVLIAVGTRVTPRPYRDRNPLEWKKKHQTEATEDQMKTFEETKPLHAVISGHQKS